MSLFVTSLNSGSNGNCYYVGNQTEAVLIDAGIACLEIEKRMSRLGLSMQKIKAVLISHEHTDHISGLEVLTKKYQLPVYITNATYQYSGLRLEKNLVRHFLGYEPITIGNLTITAFPKSHDAADPYSFVVAGNQTRVGIFTDMGFCCNHVIRHFQQCHAAFLESNYDELMLDKGRYPYFLKSRIRGDKGHLSNQQALDLFIAHRPTFMTHLFLSHLSKNNNCPEVVLQMFKQHANQVEMIVASRNASTEVYHICDTGIHPIKQSGRASQLSFAFT
jgi:phosphoribosyl 1,2-cyclic phosphodiesterase